MTARKVFIRGGTRQGAQHVNRGFNNQDAWDVQTFDVPLYGKSYYIGLVSDGCTGNPLFSRTEVGAHILTMYAYRRIQELILSGLTLPDIPKALYPSLTEFLLDMIGKLMPSNILWPYPMKVKGRERWDGQTRLRHDYLAATLLGFVTDMETLVLFNAGDGIIAINEQAAFIDQDNLPEYPAVSINQPGKGFDATVHKMTDIRRVSVMTDGLKELLKREPSFLDKMFAHERGNPFGLRFLLNQTFVATPELMQDDCTAVTFEMREA